jgi:hypothetical protein
MDGLFASFIGFWREDFAAAARCVPAMHISFNILIYILKIGDLGRECDISARLYRRSASYKHDKLLVRSSQAAGSPEQYPILQ